MKIKRVLVPIDFSEHSLQALDYAVDLCREADPDFIVMSALDRVQFADVGQLYGTPVAVQDLVEEQRRVARTELAALANRLGKRGLRVRTFLRDGSPHRAIADEAKKLKPDLIVMGTHGRTGVSRLLLGSVAEWVVRHASCPVLVVREGGKKVSSRRKKR